MFVVAVYLSTAILFGSLISWALVPWVDIEYEKLLTRGVLLALAMGLIPMWRHFSMSREDLGFESLDTFQSSLSRLARAFTVGLIVILPPMVFFSVVGFRVLDPRVDWLEASLWGFFLWAFCSAFLVALFEETLFRGLFLTGAMRRYGLGVAICLTSTCYALVHFLRGPETFVGAEHEVEWYTGFIFAASVARELFVPQAYWDSFIALFLLGCLLCFVRLRYGLWHCIAMHASWVFAIRVFKEGTVRDIVNPYIGWVGTYDHFVGHLVSVWLVFIFLLIHLNDQRAEHKSLH